MGVLEEALEREQLPPDLAVALFRDSPDAIIVVSSERVIKLANPQAELLFGYHHSEMIGEQLEMLIPQDLRERHIDHVSGFCREPRVRPMGIGRRLHALRKDGTQVQVEINLAPKMTPMGLLVIAVVRRARDPQPVDA